VQLVAVLEHRDIVPRHYRDHRENRAVGLPALGAAAGMIVGDISLDADLDRLVLALADQRTAGEVPASLLDAIVDRRMNMDSHSKSSLVLRLEFSHVRKRRQNGSIFLHASGQIRG